MDKTVGKVIYVVFDEFRNEALGDEGVETNIVYRCLIMPDGKYRVETPLYENGIVFDEMSGDDEHGVFSFREVKVEDIIDSNLPEEQIDKIVDWERDGENDKLFVRDVFPIDIIREKIEEGVAKIHEGFKENIDAWNKVSQEDPLFQQALLDAIKYIDQAGNLTREEGTLSEAMRYKLKDSNLFECVNYLDLYIETENIEFVYEALNTLVTEIKRFKIRGNE